MEEQKEKLAQYYISIKQQQQTQGYYSYSYNDPKKQAAQEAAKQKIEDAFIKVVNEVVALGGVVCMDKNQLNDEWRIIATGFSVKLLPSVVSKIQAMPDVSSCTIQNQN